MDYKKYSLEKLQEWVHDAMNSDASPHEIYSAIREAVREDYYYYKHHCGRAYELLALLNGNGVGHVTCDKDDISTNYKGNWNDFWEENYYPEEDKKDKVTKWQLPVEVDGPSGEYFVSFPDDLLEAANLNEGDQVDWVDQGDGSYLLRKVTRPLRIDEC